MSNRFDALWLSASPSLRCFNRPLQQFLVKHTNVVEWQYFQDLDEGSCVFKAVSLLEDYLEACDRPLHLIGHGISGAIGLLYARLHPQKVQTLTLLSVAAQPAITWHSHYYVQRHLSPCSRQQVLAQTVRNLFGSRPPYSVKALVNALDKDLEQSPCLQSLFHPVDLPKGGVSMPLMICGSQTDTVVDPMALHQWLSWLKPNDVLWECPEGRHFFQYFYPQLVGEQILKFWESSDSALSVALTPIENVKTH